MDFSDGNKIIFSKIFEVEITPSKINYFKVITSYIDCKKFIAKVIDLDFKTYSVTFKNERKHFDISQENLSNSKLILNEEKLEIKYLKFILEHSRDSKINLLDLFNWYDKIKKEIDDYFFFCFDEKDHLVGPYHFVEHTTEFEYKDDRDFIYRYDNKTIISLAYMSFGKNL